MKQVDTGRVVFNEHPSIDYSIVYKKSETKQLQIRLRRTKVTLLIASLAFISGGILFLNIQGMNFSKTHLFSYIIMAFFLAILAFVSHIKPFVFLILAILACVGLWGIEILLGITSNFQIEGAIHKLSVISLLISGLHSSKEAELIKNELDFS